VGNEYFMWYEGRYIASYPFQNTICLAKSSDGLIWKKASDNPVFSAASTKIDVFDSRVVGSPSVICDGKMFRMWYFGSGYGTNIGYAVSSDGMKWFRMKHLVFLGALFGAGQKGVSELGRSQPVITCVNGEFKMWYVGTNTEGVQSLAYATSSPLNIPHNDMPKSAVAVLHETFDEKDTLTNWQILGTSTHKRYCTHDSSFSVSPPHALSLINEEENDIGPLYVEKVIPGQKREFVLEFEIRLSSEKVSGQWILGITDHGGVFTPAVDFFIASGELWSNYLNGDPMNKSQMKGSLNYGEFSFKKDRWYTMRTRVDVEHGTFAIWVDGILLERSLEIGKFSFSNMDEINTLRFGTIENGTTFWIDNVKITGLPFNGENQE